jgi:uncharacterized membrane protein HdeD (DUF308 family)
MSASTAHTGLAGPLHRVTGKWGWFVALGVVSILAGMFALTDVVAFTLVSTIFIGAMLLVSGIFQIIHAFATRTWGQFALTVLLGLLYIAGGLLIMDEPVNGTFIITLMLLIALVVSGIVRIVIALRHRELKYWWLMALGGLCSAAIGIWLFLALPWSSLFILGTLIAVELLIQGVTWLQFGLALRRRHNHPHAA